MSVMVQVSALPSLFNFARVRVAHHPHVMGFVKTVVFGTVLSYIKSLGQIWKEKMRSQLSLIAFTVHTHRSEMTLNTIAKTINETITDSKCMLQR